MAGQYTPEQQAAVIQRVRIRSCSLRFLIMVRGLYVIVNIFKVSTSMKLL